MPDTGAMMAVYPIPEAAFDDRLGFVGTAGSGKTYATGTAVERLLARGDRVITVDPLGVWYGLRLMYDGKTPSNMNVVIFGGPHGDLPLTEYAGALIGETVAGMKESAILDLSELGTHAAERRFMLGFLTALYRKTNRDPLHLVFDEADMWAPQRLMDKEGDAAKLLGMMETIVRRGRVKGFIPWLITQRPAVLSKNVLSQIDGLVAMKLTSTQDRDAIGSWVEGSADKGEWKQAYAKLATLPRGQALLWIPGRGEYRFVEFPGKVTFDSSATPKRGEKRKAATLAPLDLSAVREKLSTVEAEVKANDPALLRREIADLRRQVQAKPTQAAMDPQAIERARQEGRAEGEKAAQQWFEKWVVERWQIVLSASEQIRKALDCNVPTLPGLTYKSTAPSRPQAHVIVEPRRNRPPSVAAQTGGKLSAAERKFLTVLAQRSPNLLTRDRIAVLAGYSVSSGHNDTTLSALRTKGWIEGPGSGIKITDAGLAALGDFEPLPTGRELQNYWYGRLDKAGRAFLQVIIGRYPETVTRNEVAEAAGYNVSSGHVDTTLSYLRSLGIVTGPGSAIRASDDLF